MDEYRVRGDCIGAICTNDPYQNAYLRRGLAALHYSRGAVHGR